jgi:hypothetical protein
MSLPHFEGLAAELALLPVEGTWFGPIKPGKR